ncbi:MAG: T9SS type A sorting domain-containing protein [Flavobacteriales bacterium]|nr:T9SS type A sorting domain-containing protein [Flavobacteriales bacterium]
MLLLLAAHWGNTPEAAAQNTSCVGVCGTYIGGPPNCNCDDLCWTFADCCADICTSCTSTGPNWDAGCAGPNPDSCVGFCGVYPGPGNCNCDDLCWTFADCCADICTSCTSTGPNWDAGCAGPNPDSCVGFCGVYPGPGNCNCDDLCWTFADCCADICTSCTSTGPNWDAGCAGPNPDSCVGFCGVYPGPGNCNCDDLCWTFADCCADICTSCTSTGPNWDAGCAGPNPDSCVGFCGVYPGPGNCNCDDLCWTFADCCADICTSCTSTGPNWDAGCAGPNPDSCVGFCGVYPGPGNCNCDDLCWTFADCCADICTSCTSTGTNWDANCSGGGGDCCTANLTPGCDDAVCEDTICGLDAFCCDVSWDELCAGQALLFCGDLCGTECDPPPACVLEDTVSYGSVVAFDPTCCTVWSPACQGLFDSISFACTGVICVDVPPCVASDPEAYEAVIADDSFCCESFWDGLCQSQFDALSDACVPPACPDPTAFLEFQFDAYPNENTWAIFNDGDNSLVAFGGPYPGLGGQIWTEPLCLPNGCYRLEVYDSFGDGMDWPSDNFTGGYTLRTVDGDRIIDNLNNFVNSAATLSTLTPGESWCLPVGTDRPIYTSCDRYWWTSGDYLVATENATVSAQFGVNNANSGYEFWFFDPNGSLSFRKLRTHAVSDGFAPNNALRAAHIKLNNWAVASQLQDGVLYNVRIRGVANGSFTGNGEYGPACRVTLDPTLALCPPTGLNDIPDHPNFSCGVSRTFGGPNSAANRLYARSVAGANKYEFEFSNADEAYLFTRFSNNVQRHLNWPASQGDPLLVGSTYQVRVRASKDGGTTWCDWGWVCDVTIAPAAAPGNENMAMENITLNMWPNPNNGQQLWLTLDEVAADVETVAVDIYDLSGKRIVAREVAAQGGHLYTVLDLNGDLAAGVYMVNIIAGDAQYTQRLVIQP